MSKIIGLMKGIISYPFRLIKRIAGFSVLVTVMFIAWKGLDYFNNGHQFNQGGVCKPIIEQLAKFNGETYCLDARKLDKGTYENKKKYSTLLYLARKNDTETAYQGHGWLIWFQFEQLDDEIIRIHEFLPAGYGGDEEDVEWSKEQVELYANFIKPNIPKQQQALIERMLKGLALGPTRFDESTVVIHSSSPFDIKIDDLEGIFKTDNLGEKPSILASIVVDLVDYEKSKNYFEEYTSKTYRVFFHDCTTLLLNLSDQFGMYRPPRIICPYPHQSIATIFKLNQKE